VQQDGNWNVTALLNTTGALQERVVYDPYGNNFFLDASGSSTTDSFTWIYLHQGGRLELNTGLYLFRHRDYSTKLGRWMQQEPFGGRYLDGANLYQYLRSNAENHGDPFGFQATQPTQPSPAGSKTAIECSTVYTYGIPTGKHCSVVGTCKGKNGLRWEDAGGRAKPGEGVDDHSGHPDNQENGRKKERPVPDGYLDQGNGYPSRTDWKRYDVSIPQEKCPCDQYNCFKEAARRANFVPYAVLGPNSNTFAHSLLKKCGGELTPYEGTNYRWHSYPEWAEGWNVAPPDYWGNWNWVPCSGPMPPQ